ncbi:hypothetical protein [Sinosporangium siamense]|uniref:Uncharacterized protein n=1 Tax=Sinosporangium siamense TaxID=1367973 RepID=A0A919RGX5_9ACTN|nr:hypothetical protein [Sinosporangium siamense]GII91629.1 hypothetical protein Ssi02_18600 [Sinosporangium siamense]
MTDLEERLRDTFTARAESARGRSDPYEAVMGRVRRARGRRRKAVAGVLAAASVLVAVQQFEVVSVRQSPLAEQQQQEEEQQEQKQRRVRGVLAWPARGSLARDADFLGEMRAWSARETARVLYAEDAGDLGRVVVAALWNGSTWRVALLEGEAGTSVARLTEHAISDVGPEVPVSAPLYWFGEERSVALVVGPPEMTKVKISGGIDYLADGTPSRVVHTPPVDNGVVFTEVPEPRSGQIAFKAQVGDTVYPEAVLPSKRERDADAFSREVGKAARRAAGTVDPARALDLLYSVPALASPVERLTYDLLWGGSLGDGRDAVVATVSGPGTPTFLAVQVIGVLPGGVTETALMGRVVPRDLWPDGARARGEEPVVAWTTRENEVAVYTPTRPRSKVEIHSEGRILVEGTTDATGFVLLRPLTPPSLQSEARILDERGRPVVVTKTHLGDLWTAVHGDDSSW